MSEVDKGASAATIQLAAHAGELECVCVACIVSRAYLAQQAELSSLKAKVTGVAGEMRQTAVHVEIVEQYNDLTRWADTLTGAE